jgi:hypothetical protein
VEIATEKMKWYKSPGTYQIPAKLIKAGSETLYSEIHKLIHSIWNKDKFPKQWKESITIPFIERVMKQTVIIMEESPSYQFPTKFYPAFLWQG